MYLHTIYNPETKRIYTWKLSKDKGMLSMGIGAFDINAHEGSEYRATELFGIPKPIMDSLNSLSEMPDDNRNSGLSSILHEITTALLTMGAQLEGNPLQ